MKNEQTMDIEIFADGNLMFIYTGEDCCKNAHKKLLEKVTLAFQYVISYNLASFFIES